MLESQVLSGDLWRTASTQTSTQQSGWFLSIPVYSILVVGVWLAVIRKLAQTLGVSKIYQKQLSVS